MRLALIAAFGLAAACTLPPAPVFRTPPTPGRTWVYRVQDPQGLTLGQITTKLTAVDGTRVTQETTEVLNGVTTTRQSVATFQEDGSLTIEEADGRVSPLPSIRHRLAPGATWENPDGSRATVEGQEALTVPAGTYVVYRIRLSRGELRWTDWLSPAVGLVKERSDKSVIELTSYQG